MRRRDDDRTPAIAAELRARIGELAEELFGQPSTRSRSELRFGASGWLSIKLDTGQWMSFRDGFGGDALELVAWHLGHEVKTKTGRAAAFRWAKKWLGACREPETSSGTCEAVRARPQQEPNADDRNRAEARWIWDRAWPCLAHTPAEVYLRRRHIWEPAKDALLRYDELQHPQTRCGTAAIVVPRHNPATGTVDGVQRIFLNPDGRKYDRGTAKKMSLGQVTGGRAELFPVGPMLVVAEGLESALSAALLLELPAWACCGGFPNDMSLPAAVRRIILAADNDASGVLLRRARALATSLRHRGIAARIQISGETGSDANDALANVDPPQWRGAGREYTLDETFDIFAGSSE